MAIRVKRVTRVTRLKTKRVGGCQFNFCSSFNIFNCVSGSHDLPLWPARAWIDLPKANAAKKSISVVSSLNAARQRVELLRAPAANNHIIRNQRFLQQQDGAKDFAFPRFFAQLFHSRFPDVILDDVPVAVRQIAKLQREHVGFPNQCRSQPGAESKKQHTPALETAEGLHGCIVDDADGFTQRLLVIEPSPTRSEVFWFAHDAPIANWRWKSHGDAVEAPIPDQCFHLSHHFARRQIRAGFEFSLFPAGNHQLHIRAAYVDDENPFLHSLSDLVAPPAGFSCTTLIGINLSARGFFFYPVSVFVGSRDTSRNCHCACRLGSGPSVFKPR